MLERQRGGGGGKSEHARALGGLHGGSVLDGDVGGE